MKYQGTIAYRGGVLVVLEEWCHSWWQMMLYNEKIGFKDIYYHRTQASLHHDAANDLAAQFKGDWLIMFDTDHIFPGDIPSELVATADEYNIDVLTGFYQLRKPPYTPTIYHLTDDKRFEVILPQNRFIQPIPIDGAGIGCLFVRRKVFEKLHEIYPTERPFDYLLPLGEDFSFFTRLKNAGIQAYCAPWLEFHHLKSEPVIRQDCRALLG